MYGSLGNIKKLNYFCGVMGVNIMDSEEYKELNKMLNEIRKSMEKTTEIVYSLEKTISHFRIETLQGGNLIPTKHPSKQIKLIPEEVEKE
jgi:hypothetical protein